VNIFRLHHIPNFDPVRFVCSLVISLSSEALLVVTNCVFYQCCPTSAEIQRCYTSVHESEIRGVEHETCYQNDCRFRPVAILPSCTEMRQVIHVLHMCLKQNNLVLSI